MTQKVKKLLFSAETLLFLASGKFEVIAHDLPEDARLSKINYIENNKTLELFVESETFPEIDSEKDKIQTLTAPIIRRIK